MESEDPLMWSR